MRKMSQLFEGVEGVFCYIGDILIYGKDMEEHNRRLSAVMKIVLFSGLKLNLSKYFVQATRTQISRAQVYC